MGYVEILNDFENFGILFRQINHIFVYIVLVSFIHSASQMLYLDIIAGSDIGFLIDNSNASMVLRVDESESNYAETIYQLRIRNTFRMWFCFCILC